MKYVRKLIPVEPYEIDALESWFSDLSAEGLHLYTANTFFATFEEKEEKRMIYRMEAKLDGLPDRPADKEKDSHKGKGWEFVTELGKYFFIYSAEEGTADYFDDPTEESKCYQTYAKKERFWNSPRFLCCFYGVLIAAFVIGEILSLRHKTAYDWVRDMELPFDSLPMILFSLFPSQRLAGMQRLQKSLAEGNPHPQGGDWMDGGLRWKHRLHYIGCIGLFASFFFPLLPWAFTFSDKPIEELKHPLPMVSLAELENDPDFYSVDTYFQRDDGLKEEWWERESGRAYSEPTVGAPMDISFNQAGRIDGKLDASGAPYESVLWIDYKELASFVSPREYLEEYFQLPWNSGEKYTTLTDTPFDYAVLAERGDATELYLVSGQKILELTYYYGDVDLTAHYDLYEKVLQQEYKR